ncbi:MAG: DUF1488 domain-containing protein [Oricola sp.]
MTLAFPNRSRDYDDTRQQVRFVGYEGMFAIPFRVDADAIVDGAPQGPDDEAVCLAAFDRKRAAIESVASEVYSNSRKAVYVLTSADFR